MHKREYPEIPLVGVGGVVIHQERALLVRRASEPSRGEWSIPGGLLEVGETLIEGVARELREETGLTVRVLRLLDAFDRIVPADGLANSRPRYHYVLLDYLCEIVAGEAAAASDASELAWASEEQLAGYNLAPATLALVRLAFTVARGLTAAPNSRSLQIESSRPKNER
jgi:ADP-ribose pyrophosphatase YjhB (NUDIX family)